MSKRSDCSRRAWRRDPVQQSGYAKGPLVNGPWWSTNSLFCWFRRPIGCAIGIC